MAFMLWRSKPQHPTSRRGGNGGGAALNRDPEMPQPLDHAVGDFAAGLIDTVIALGKRPQVVMAVGRDDAAHVGHGEHRAVIAGVAGNNDVIMGDVEFLAKP